MKRIRELVSPPEYEHQFEAVLDQSIAGVFVISEDGTVRYVNAGFAQLSGRTQADVIGQRLLEFVADGDQGQVVQYLQAALHTQQSPIEARYRSASGDLRTVLAQAAPTRFEGAPAVIGVAIDVTGRQQAEAALARANGLLRVINAANEALVRSSTEPHLMTNTCRALVDVGHVCAASIVLRSAQGRLDVAAFAGDGRDDIRDMEVRWLAERAKGGHAEAMGTGRARLYEDWARERDTQPWAAAALAAGVRASVYLPLMKDAHAIGSLSVHTTDPEFFQADALATLAELADDLAYGISALRDRAERDASTVAVHRSLEETVAVLAAAAEMRDPYTAGHQQQVAVLAVAIARELGLDESRVRAVRFAALVHDVGKIRIPAELLTRPGLLTELERRLIQTHAQAGYDILKNVEFPWPIADFVLQHHEHVDGTGYPNGVSGSALHLESRILTVADVVEAVSADRPYRGGKGIEAALAEILDGRGSRYDTDVVNACTLLFRAKNFAFAAPYIR